MTSNSAKKVSVIKEMLAITIYKTVTVRARIKRGLALVTKRNR